MALAELQGLAVGSGLLKSVAEMAVIAGTLVLLLLLIALGAFVYKTVKGDGMKDPREVDQEEATGDDGVRRGRNDEEWKYY